MLRALRCEDTEAVAGVWLAASLAAHSFIPAGYWKSRVDDLRGHYLPLSETVVYEDEQTGRVVGFLSLVDDYLAALFVEPGHWGKGIGSRLLALAMKMRGELDLAVYEKNVRAVEFYRRHGFRVAERRVEQATSCVELVMVLERTR